MVEKYQETNQTNKQYWNNKNKSFINEQWMTTPQFLESQNKYYNTLAGNSVIDPPQFATLGKLSPIRIGLVKSRLKLIDTSKSNHSHDFPHRYQNVAMRTKYPH